MPSRSDTYSGLEAALAGAPADVAGVVGTLRAIDAALPAQDGLARFNRLYLAVTESVEQALAGRAPAFGDPAFVARLDVVFADLYLDALRADLDRRDAVPRAWAPLLAARRHPGVAPLQHALAGMNAHINRDLPVALVRTFEALGRRPARGSAEHADYLHVNVLLAETEARVRESFSTGLAGWADRKLGDLDGVAAMWKVTRARDAAWTNGEALWRLREAPELADAFLASLDRTVGLAGRGLLRPARAPRAVAALARGLDRLAGARGAARRTARAPA